MTSSNKKTIGIVAAVILLIGGAAAVASYTVSESSDKPSIVTRTNNHAQPQKVAAVQQPVQPGCDDKNIVGTIVGGAAGGLAGSQIGKGSGKTAAIIGGTAGGALLGKEFIPTRNVTCP